MIIDEQFFSIYGIDKKSASLLALAMLKPTLKIDEFSSKLDLSRSDMNSIIKKLISKKIIDIIAGKNIRIRPEFALKAAGDLENSMEIFTDKLRATRFLIIEKFVEEIEKIFQIEGYRIKRDLARETRYIDRKVEIAFKFIAEKFYRFGALVIDPEIFDTMRRIRDHRYVFPSRFFIEMQTSSSCIGTFIFFDPRLDKRDVYPQMKWLYKERDIYSMPTKEQFLFIPKPEENIREFILHNLNEIEIRRDTVEQRFKELKDEMKKTKDLIVEDSMMISELSSLTSGKYYMAHRPKNENFSEFIVPIKSVVDREARNLEIFERKYEEEKGLIEGEMVEFDKRLILPNPSILKEKSVKIRKLKSKFEPIRHELRSLLDQVLSPYISGNQPMRINPFVLTEPNDIEAFTVNQDSIKKTASGFFQHLISGGSNLLFVVGAAGTGKTHTLKHVFFSMARKLKVWPIYVDCPLKYDIVSSLFGEITQDSNFPKAIHQFLPSFRKKRVSTEIEFIEIIRKLNELIQTKGYKYLLLIIDELENSLPYTYDIKHGKEFDESEESPLALRQLKEILSSNACRNIGFVFAFRDHILAEVKSRLKLKYFNKFVCTPEILNEKHFKELIELRYETWHSKHITFQLPVIREVISLTNSNTRHTVQYFRALYNEAASENRKKVTLKILKSVGKLPLFTY